MLEMKFSLKEYIYIYQCSYRDNFRLIYGFLNSLKMKDLSLKGVLL